MVNSAFTKCIDVVTSCETLDQVYYATRYIELADKHHKVTFAENYLLIILCKIQFNNIINLTMNQEIWKEG